MLDRERIRWRRNVPEDLIHKSSDFVLEILAQASTTDDSGFRTSKGKALRMQDIANAVSMGLTQKLIGIVWDSTEVTKNPFRVGYITGEGHRSDPIVLVDFSYAEITTIDALKADLKSHKIDATTITKTLYNLVKDRIILE